MFRKGGVSFVPPFSQDFPRESPAFSVAVVDKGAVEYLLQIRYKDILLINPLPPPLLLRPWKISMIVGP